MGQFDISPRAAALIGLLLCLPITSILALATMILAGIGLFMVAFVVDQYPCWIGVPNCD